MSVPETRLDSTNIQCLNHPCSQIKIKGKYLVIPEKYHELFLESLDENENIDQLPATQSTWDRIQAIYISAFWVDIWYNDNLPTPKSYMIDFTINQRQLLTSKINQILKKNWKSVSIYSINIIIIKNTTTLCISGNGSDRYSKE